MTLSCGGKGPCCHVGYSHRHCECCDFVIDTRTAGWWYPVVYPTYPAPVYPTYWWQNPIATTGYVDIGGGNHTSENAFSSTPAALSTGVHSCPS